MKSVGFARIMFRALVYCAFAYLAAVITGAVVAGALGSEQPLSAALAADVAATLVVFAFSVALNNSSMYDPYWSVAPPLLGAYYLQLPAAPEPGARSMLVLALVTLWGVRLTYNFLRGWKGLAHEDFRYVDLRRKTGRAYWLVSLLGLHLMPTCLVFAGCLPLYAAFATRGAPLNAVDACAAVVTLGAIVLEAVADAQLRQFRARAGARPDEILATGVWAWSRHPNYLGEMLFWWGLYLFALAAGPEHAWTGVGALSITLLFRFVSLRLLETRMLERRPAYAERIRTVPAFLPFPRLRRGSTRLG